MNRRLEEIILVSHWDVRDPLQPTRLLRKGPSLESSEADPISVPLPKVQFDGKEYLTCQLRYTKEVKRVTLARYLCGKVTHTPEEVTRIDLLILYDNFLYIQEIASKNENFREKFGDDLESLAKILKGFRLSSKTSSLDVRKLATQMEEKINKFILPKRNLSTVAGRCSKMFRVIPFTQLKEKKKLPPKAYIGKGYADKGTARDPAVDNSPSWQEVAMQPIEEKPK